jgi:histidine ammonia-lyase
LARQLLVAAACAIDAIRAPLSPYSPAVARLAGDPLLGKVLGRLGVLLSGSQRDRTPLQAPVSFRVIPQVLSHLERTLGRLEEDIRRTLRADTDSPAFVDGEFVTSGEFHAVGLTADIDALCHALALAAELAGQHIHRLLDRRFSGLPDQLTSSPGPQAGLIVIQKRVVGALHELRRLVLPAGLGLADTSLGQEDAMAFSFEAAEKLSRAEGLVREVIACELLVARQAWFLRGEPIPIGLHDIYGDLCRVIPPIKEDRPLGGDITVLAGVLGSGTFSGAR